MLAAVAAGLVVEDVGAEPETFRVGMVARKDGADREVEGLSVIRSAFSRALGMKVEVFVARDYAALIEAQVAGRLDYAVYSAQAYAAASIRCGCLRPVVAPIDSAGSVGLRSVLITRRGEAEPRRIAFGPGDSLSGRLVPLAAWPQARAAAEEGRFVEVASASDAEAMFVDGSVDGFFGWVPAGAGDGDMSPGGSLARLRIAGVAEKEYEVRWRSDVLRYGPHAVRADIEAGRVGNLARMLVRAASEEPELYHYMERVHGGGFVEVTQADYAAPIEAVSGLTSP